VATGESYVYNSTVDGSEVCVKNLTQYGFRSSTGSSPLKLSTKEYAIMEKCATDRVITERRIQEICEPYGCVLITPSFKVGLVMYDNPFIAYMGKSGTLVNFVCGIDDNTTEEELERRVASWSVRKAFS